MLCPRRSRSCRESVITPSGASPRDEAFLDGDDLREPARMPRLVAEARVRERAHDLARDLLADDARADAEDVHVVVLDGLVRRVRVVAHARPDAGELVGRDADADAAPAEADA